jgi:hypothetical protein
MPECDCALAQAAIYLATAPKSNSVEVGYHAARQCVRDEQRVPVPLHLRNAPTQVCDMSVNQIHHRVDFSDLYSQKNHPPNHLGCIHSSMSTTIQSNRPSSTGSVRKFTQFSMMCSHVLHLPSLMPILAESVRASALEIERTAHPRFPRITEKAPKHSEKSADCDTCLCLCLCL